MPKTRLPFSSRAKAEAERITYRLAGLPVAIAAILWGGPDDLDALRAAYADFYWQPGTFREGLEIAAAGVLWPFAVAISALWFTWRNGAIIRRRHGKSIPRQLIEELRAAVSSGVLPPWYYAFELFDPKARAGSFLNRFETKQGFYRILIRRRHSESPLGDKLAFAHRCHAGRVATVPVLATAEGGEVTCFDGDGLPARDLFLKPVHGRGGTGAERWDHDGHGGYLSSDGRRLSESDLQAHLAELSRTKAYLVQPRLTNCAELGDINNGALSTVRIMTCLNEHDRPEVVAAVLRMATGDNHRVDNFHAGGIAAAVDLETGELSSASNLGMDATLGWLDRHPTSNAPIRGRKVPQWAEACELARRAHRAFDDRVVVGWDIGLTADGPVIVEGNSRPDVDIMQRPARAGLAEGRLGRLLLHHIKA